MNHVTVNAARMPASIPNTLRRLFIHESWAAALGRVNRPGWVGFLWSK